MFASSSISKHAEFFVVLSILIATGQASAATINLSDGGAQKNSPIAQKFLDDHGDNVSFLATRKGASCVASKSIPIATSVYVDASGAPVEYKDIVRSPAASIQAVSSATAEMSFRIQLKYSPDRTKSISLNVAGKILDLAPNLEPSGDSIWLAGADAQILLNAFREGNEPLLTGVSEDSGRQITDQITAPDLTGIDACQVLLQELLSVESAQKITEDDLPASVDTTEITSSVQLDESWVEQAVEVSVDQAAPPPTIPVAVAGLRLKFSANPDPATRIAPSTLEHCRMQNIPENVYLGRLIEVTGFFSQTQDIYVAFDDQGRLARAYIPGIFDSELKPEGGAARLSIAADSNVPDQRNIFKGCLGDAVVEAPVCSVTEQGSDIYTITECGVLGTSETRRDVLSYLLDPASLNQGVVFKDPRTVQARSTINGLVERNVLNSEEIKPVIFPNLPNGDTGQNSVDDGVKPGGNDNSIAPVPLPGGIWFLLGALISVLGFAKVACNRNFSIVSCS